jgi:hypothetical protein
MSQMKYFPGSYQSFDRLTLSEYKGVRRSLGYIAPLFVSFQTFQLNLVLYHLLPLQGFVYAYLVDP